MTRRNVFMCIAWIGAVLVIGGSLWFCTRSYRTRLLMETVNKTLAENGYEIRIEAFSGFSGGPASVMGGQWFMVTNSSDRAFVFTILRYGIGAACVALVDNNGKVKTIIPLSSNARQITDKLPMPVYRFYVDRIERDPQNGSAKKEALR